MTGESWEARMAARAAERARVAAILSTSVEAVRYARHRADVERLGRAWQASMTLGQAIELRNAAPWACACVGPPHCCRFRGAQAAALHRGAHIVARLLADTGGRDDTPV